MSVDFRCENCGKLLSIEGDAGDSTKCPHCGKKATIPAAVAAMPRPKVAPNAPQPQPQPQHANPQTAPTHQYVEEAPHNSEMMTVMAGIMPWLISVFFHVGVAMILAFATMMAGAVANPEDEAEEAIVPDAAWSETPGGSLVESKNTSAQPRDASSVARSDYARKDAVSDTGLSKGRAAIGTAGGIGASGGGGSGKGDMLGLRGGGGGPKSTLYGTGGNAHHVVYVIDRSGSMLDKFEYVKREMTTSMSKLRPVQDFHIIFFDEGTVQENPPKQLVQATPENLADAASFLENIRPERRTDPLPALKRAFEVLDKADPKKKGKLLYLLTDAAFPDNNKVRELVTKMNTKKDVYLVTFLYDSTSPETAKFMEALAKENNGRFKLIAEE